MTARAARRRPHRHVYRLLAVLALVGLTTTGVTPQLPRVALSADDAPAAAAVTTSKVVSRAYYDDDGTRTVQDHRTVELSVAQTTNLRSLQLIHVSWSGAHPTGGLVPDQNSDLAQNEEYPMALFECRGTDTAAHPITPDTCWTQYADERFTSDSGTIGSTTEPGYPAWRSDAAATAAQRRPVVNAPSSLSDECRRSLSGAVTQRWVPFRGADGVTYAGGPFGCAGLPPEASPANLTGNLALPSNETFGVSDTDGKGEADFDVFTASDHASLGCSQQVACTLVAVPVEGISCDPAGSLLPEEDRPSADGVADARDNCEQDGRFAPGQLLTSGSRGTAAVDGASWWSPSNWANRISVPLSFAPADDVCALDSTGTPRDIYGSELMIQATTAWAPYFCLDKNLFTLNHVQTPEPQARSILANDGIDAAFTTRPPDTAYTRPTVQAPVSLTGFGIAFQVDDANRAPLTNLKLDARLLAKLLTESYPDSNDLRNQYPYGQLANNPYNITFDPEFQALNPGVPARFSDTASTLLTLSSDSDVTYALTSYIDADPEARAWLDGKPDPWGMRVNPNYAGIALPVNNWPLLDTYEEQIADRDQNVCLYFNPTPFLPLVASPQSRLFTIGQDMQFSLGQSQTVCVQSDPNNPYNPQAAKLVAVGRQTIGTRAMFGVVSLGDAARDGLRLASLETQTTSDAVAQFTNADGRTFVPPTTASLRAAVSGLEPSASNGTWQPDYAALRSDPSLSGAYPGAMPVYAAIATQGLDRGEARDYGRFLDFAAGRGQQAGTAQGDLPDGYLPMTAGNGAAALAAYTRCAAEAVALQNGVVPTVGAPCPKAARQARAPRTVPTGSGGAAGGATGSTAPAAPNPAAGTNSVAVAPPATSSPAARSSIDAAPAADATPGYGSTLSGVLLPLLFLVFLLGAIGTLVLRVLAAGRRAR